jgi:hypothetical protein
MAMMRAFREELRRALASMGIPEMLAVLVACIGWWCEIPYG